MKTFYTESEQGGVLVGNKEFGVLLHNGYGDGMTDVYVFDSIAEIDEWRKLKRVLRFNTYVEGRINIYDNDRSQREDQDVAIVIEGRYAVYHGELNGEPVVVFAKK